MNCAEIQPLLHAWFDGELDSVRALDVERHVHDCSGCAGAKRSLESLRTALRSSNLIYRAPASLRDSIRASVMATSSSGSSPATQSASTSPGAGSVSPAPRGSRSAEQSPDLGQPSGGGLGSRGEGDRPRGSGWLWKLLALGATALAAAVFFVRFGAISEREQLATEIVTAHVRSLMAEHLTDVASSDQHTVKPWFEGKLDFAPGVKDFADQGFPLVGGRLDFLHGRPVAALIYRRNKHLINVFVWPAGETREPGAKPKYLRGYSLLNREIDGLHYCLISDLNSPELNALADLLASK